MNSCTCGCHSSGCDHRHNVKPLCVECGERVYVNDPRLIKKLATLIKELAVAREALERYESAIRWALGEGDDFPMREPGEGAYWWRNELRRRAALKLEAPTK